MTVIQSTAKVGVYCDVANMYRNGGQRMQYDVLREFACRDYAEPVRLNAYVTYDAERAQRDYTYRDGAKSFHSKLRDYGYKVIVKEISWYRDDSGSRYGTLLQNRGCRVEIVGLDNSSNSLRQEPNLFISGFLSRTPGGNRAGALEARHRPEWGEIGSRVRGWCYWHEADRSFGYMRFLQKIASGLRFTDARLPDSPVQFSTPHRRWYLCPIAQKPPQIPGGSPPRL